MFAFSPKVDSINRLADLHTFRPERPRFAVLQYIVESEDKAWTVAKK